MILKQLRLGATAMAVSCVLDGAFARSVAIAQTAAASAAATAHSAVTIIALHEALNREVLGTSALWRSE